jgi:glycerate-2-kinase
MPVEISENQIRFTRNSIFARTVGRQSMSNLKNKKSLLSHGNIAARRLALDIVDYALSQSDPYRAARNRISHNNDELIIDTLQLDLKLHQRIFLIGAGKATFPIASALEDLLGDRIADGVIICKYGQGGSLSRSRLYLADHPVPDIAGFDAAKRVLKLVRSTKPGDLIISCFTGGSSALLPYPVSEVTFKEKQRLNQLLLNCGANIIEINTVRKHLSQVKGGRLALAIHPQAHLINLTVSDVIGDPLDYITDPTVPDTSTLDEARAVFTKYDLWNRMPASVGKFLKTAGPDQETPKMADLSGCNRHDFILVSSDAACEAAQKKSKELGLNTLILSTMLEGESKMLGGTFVSIAKEIVFKGRPLKPPCTLIGGGETTVTIPNRANGIGGPNQEFALSAATGIDHLGNIVIVGLDTDGTDGPTGVAGAVVDDKTMARARENGIDLFECLTNHDATSSLLKLEDAIVTGATGTNVNDLKLMIILAQKESR